MEEYPLWIAPAVVSFYPCSLHPTSPIDQLIAYRLLTLITQFSYHSFLNHLFGREQFPRRIASPSFIPLQGYVYICLLSYCPMLKLKSLLCFHFHRQARQNGAIMVKYTQNSKMKQKKIGGV